MYQYDQIKVILIHFLFIRYLHHFHIEPSYLFVRIWKCALTSAPSVYAEYTLRIYKKTKEKPPAVWSNI